MRSGIIVLTYFIFLSLFVNSQTPEIDSLRNLINTTKVDTVKINSLNELANKLIRVDLQNAMDTANLSIELAVNSDYPKGLAGAYKIKGILFYYFGQTDSSFYYSYLALELYKENGYLIDAAKTYNNIGIFKKNNGDLQEAIDSYFKAIEILENTNDKATLISVYINVSTAFRYIGNFQRALESNFKALEILDKYETKTASDSLQTAHIYKTIANIYTDQKNYKLAEINYFKALEIYELLNSQTDIGDIYLNLGYLEFGDTTNIENISILWYNYEIKLKKSILDSLRILKAKNYTLKSLDYYENKNKITTAYINLSEIYIELKNYDSAEYYTNEVQKLSLETGDKRSLAMSYTTFGVIYFKKKLYNKSIEYLQIALDTTNSIGDINIFLGVTENLFKSYKRIGNYEKALEMHELFKEANDSIFNTNNERSLTQVSMSYEFEKEQEQSELKHQEEIKRQKLIRNFSFAILLLVIAMLIFVFNSLRTKKRKNEELQKKNAEILQQKEEIETQRDEIEAQKEQIEIQSKEIEKQRDIAIKRGDEIEYQKREIDASIRYAQRIQFAILPTTKPLKKYFNDNFVFFKPRDVVSGDFYWIAEKNNKIIVVAADCTGHGVPGAFMSMLGISLFNQIISEAIDIQSDYVLNKIREMIMSSLKQGLDKIESIKDGMDLSLIVYSPETSEIQFSGAYNSMYIVKNKDIEALTVKETRLFSDKNKKLYEIKADRMPIGVFIIETDNFSKNSIKVDKGDKIYLFSDGYPDLYNRKDKAKFTTKRFKELLIETSDLKMSEQEKRLNQKFEEWCGGYKQIDDIIVIGLEI